MGEGWLGYGDFVATADLFVANCDFNYSGQPSHNGLIGLYTALGNESETLKYFAANDPPPFITSPITDDINNIPDQTFAEMGAFNAWVLKYKLYVAVVCRNAHLVLFCVVACRQCRRFLGDCAPTC